VPREVFPEGTRKTRENHKKKRLFVGRITVTNGEEATGSRAGAAGRTGRAIKGSKRGLRGDPGKRENRNRRARKPLTSRRPQ